MTKTLYNILVPVDFTEKNRWAIAKAIELANNFQCDIHFVHVVPTKLLKVIPISVAESFVYDLSIEMDNAGKKLERLKDEYRQHLCGAGNIEISLLHGIPSRELNSYIKNYNIDLIVIGLPRFNLVHRMISSVSVSRLARRTNIPMLAVGSNGLVNHFKKIVLPLKQELPMQSIKLATMLARSFRSTVYLVSLRNEHNAINNILKKALDVIQSISTIPAQYHMLEGTNLAKSTLEFAKRINADLIMANPLKEFNMPGFWNRLTRKLLSYGSRIPVLTIDRKSGGVSV